MPDTQYQPLRARGRIPLLTLARRLRTAYLLQKHSSGELAVIPHEPLRDLLRPGLCNACWYDLGDQVHQRKRKAPGGLGAERMGWR